MTMAFILGVSYCLNLPLTQTAPGPQAVVTPTNLPNDPDCADFGLLGLIGDQWQGVDVQVGDTFIVSDGILTVEVTIEAINGNNRATVVSWQVLSGPPVLMVIAVGGQGGANVYDYR